MSDRLYRTADGDIVPEGHADAAFLVVGDSGAVPAEYADAVKAYREGAPKAKHTPKAAEPKVASKPSGDGLDDLTADELRDRMAELDIEGRSSITRKDDMIDAIRNAG